MVASLWGEGLPKELLAHILTLVVEDAHHVLHGVAAMRCVCKQWCQHLATCGFIHLNLPLNQNFLTPEQAHSLFQSGDCHRARKLALRDHLSFASLRHSLSMASGPRFDHASPILLQPCITYTPLRVLHLSGLHKRGLFQLETLAPDLIELKLYLCPALTSLAGVERLQHLEHLKIISCKRVHSIREAYWCPRLSQLSLHRMHDINMDPMDDLWDESHYKWCNIE